MTRQPVGFKCGPLGQQRLELHEEVAGHDQFEVPLSYRGVLVEHRADLRVIPDEPAVQTQLGGRVAHQKLKLVLPSAALRAGERHVRGEEEVLRCLLAETLLAEPAADLAPHLLDEPLPVGGSCGWLLVVLHLDDAVSIPRARAAHRESDPTFKGCVALTILTGPKRAYTIAQLGLCESLKHVLELLPAHAIEVVVAHLLPLSGLPRRYRTSPRLISPEIMMLRLRDHDSRLRQSLSEGSPLVVPGTVRRDGRDAALRFGCAAVRIRSDRPAADCGIS